jgi:hypothetical protein
MSDAEDEGNFAVRQFTEHLLDRESSFGFCIWLSGEYAGEPQSQKQEFDGRSSYVGWRERGEICSG